MIYNKISGFSDEISPDIKLQFDALTRLNMKFFVPRGINGRNISELSISEVKELKTIADGYGIKASSIGSPIGKIKITDDFKKHFELYKKIVETAKILDTKFIRIFSFYHDGKNWTNEERELVFRNISSLVDYAVENDVILLHENEKDIFGDTPERCAELMAEFYCNNFKAVFDPANFVQIGIDTKYAFEVLKDYVAYLHIKDSTSDGTNVPAGSGDGNIAYIIKGLFSRGYDGFLSLEPHLGSFIGLDNLELDIDTGNMPKSSESTFTIAYNSLEDILRKI